jgi:GNAT superfamily N-acetyltransferase
MQGREDGRMADIDIQVAAPADLPAIAEFRWAEDSANEQPPMDHEQFVSEFVAWSRHPEHHCVMALDGGGVIGVAWLAVLPRVPVARRFERAGGDVQRVFVLPAFRNAGVGSAIMARVLELARELGLLSVTVHSSSRAIPMYQRAGFELKANLMTIDLER